MAAMFTLKHLFGGPGSVNELVESCCVQMAARHEMAALGTLWTSVVAARLPSLFLSMPYRVADKSLARPGNKQANVSVRIA